MKASHDRLSRAEAAANRWLPVRPTDDQLTEAQPGTHHAGKRIRGPHLRCVRKSTASNIRVPGICQGTIRRYGKEETVFYVQLGSTSKRIYTGRIGISEGFRRALELRSRWEERVEAANLAILRARRANALAQ